MSQLYRIYFSVIVYNHISCIRLVQSELFKIRGRKRASQTSNLPYLFNSFNFTETTTLKEFSASRIRQTANVRFKLRLSQNRK